MPTYEIKATNGKTYRIDGPQGASQSDVQNAVLSQHPEAGYATYREYLKASNPAEYSAVSPEFRQKYGAQSQSTLENLRAGVGNALTDILRGAAQFTQEAPLGLPGPGGALVNMLGDITPRQDVAETRRRDADLAATKAGKAGIIGGTVLGLAPAALIPGANTYAGAAAIGAGLGALQPHESGGEQLANTAIGGVASPLALGIGRGVAGLYKGAKAMLWDPLTKAGQERIAASTLQSFAGGADDAARAAQAIRGNSGNLLPGVKPTTAELADNAGLANLERILKNNPEFVQSFATRAGANRDAIKDALGGIAGDAAKRSAAVAARDSATSALYSTADDAIATADDAFAGLLKRPSMQKALERVKELAAESGDTVDVDTLSGKTLHFFKKALDDLTEGPAKNDLGKNQLGAMRDTRKAFLDWVEQRIPEYGQARTTFAQMSKPINQMDIGEELQKKLFPPLSDFGAETVLRPGSFAQALREGDVTAARALDRSSASIADILTPDQMSTLRKVGEQLARQSNAAGAGKAVGSNTGQNLIGQNVLRQMLGPLGLPEGVVSRITQGPLLQGILGAPSTIAGKATQTIGEPGIMRRLVELGLTPDEALKVLEAQIAQQAQLGAGRYIAPAVSGANAARQ